MRISTAEVGMIWDQYFCLGYVIKSKIGKSKVIEVNCTF